MEAHSLAVFGALRNVSLEVDNADVRDKWVKALRAVVAFNQAVLALKTEAVPAVVDDDHWEPAEPVSRLRSRTFAKSQRRDVLLSQRRDAARLNAAEAEAEAAAEAAAEASRPPVETRRRPSNIALSAEPAVSVETRRRVSTVTLPADTYAYQDAWPTEVDQLPPDIGGFAPVIPAAAAAVPRLPSPWLEARTDEGEAYYYNPITQVTTWDFPLA